MMVLQILPRYHVIIYLLGTTFQAKPVNCSLTTVSLA